MAVAFDAVSNVAAGTGNLSWTHTPVGTPRGVKVDIVENGGTNGVASVTYGGVAMELAAINAKTSGEAGTVITYFLGKNIPTGAQTVSVTVNDAVSKRAVATTVTAATDTCWISADISIGSDSIVNPSSTLNLLGKTCFVSLAGHSGQGAVTGTTPTTGWTSRLEHDFGAQVACWYTYNTIASTNVACGWTQTADDAVMVAVAITEAPLASDSHSVGLTESASVEVVFDARALPIILIESASVTILTTISASDLCTAQLEEFTEFSNQVFNVADTCAIQSLEDVSTAWSFPSIDSWSVQLTESASKADITPTSQQALPIGLTDSASITQVSFFPADTTAIGLGDSATLDSTAAVLSVSDVLPIGFSEQVPFFSVSDSTLLGISEARPVVTAEGGELILQVADECVIQCSESITSLNVFIPGSIQNFVVTDSLKVQLNGEVPPPTQKTTIDSLRVIVDEPVTQDGQFSVQDSLPIGATDAASSIYEISANFTVTDSLSIDLSETAQVAGVTILTASDSTRVQVPEDVPEVATVVTAVDSLRVITDEPSDQYTQLGVLDSLAAQASAEVLQIGGLLTFTVTDSLSIGLSESTSFGTSVVGTVDSCRIVASELLTNSASISAAESLRVTLSEVTTIFKDVSITDSLAVQFTDVAAPIFDSFIDIAASDSCVVQASESITELVSFLRQLTASDSVALGASDDIANLFVDTVASDFAAISADAFVDVWNPLSSSDSLKIGTTELGLAIPRVTVNIETFTDDTLLGSTDGTASVEVVYEAREKTTSDDLGVQCGEDTLLQYGYNADDLCLVGVGDTVAVEVVPNASPNTWNGNTATEHRNDKPKPWKYIFTDKLNW